MSDATLLSPKHAPNGPEAAMSEAAMCWPAVALKL